MTVEELVEAAGVDAGKAKASLTELDARFGGSLGDIPEGVLATWVNEHFYGRERAILAALGRAWERELAAPKKSKKDK